MFFQHPVPAVDNFTLEDINTAEDNILILYFVFFRENKKLTFHVNHDTDEMPCLIFSEKKKRKKKYL